MGEQQEVRRDVDYEAFLDKKSQLGLNAGFEPIFMPDYLFDFQKSLTEWALRKGRAAIFADCGLGKTICELVYARNVVLKIKRPVLIITPLAVSHQTVSEGKKFGIECARSSDGKIAADITVTNYERLHHFSADDWGGVVCDESSIIKHFGGATQKYLTRFMSKVPYRLLCTATAAPNDYPELGTSSEALGMLGYSDMLSRFFVQDDKKKYRMNEVKIARAARTGNHFAKLSYRVAQQIGAWRLKPHAEIPFWRWVCSWARACRMPSDLGFPDGDFILPELIQNEHIIIPRKAPDGMLFTLPAFGLKEERDERRRTLEERTDLVAQLVDHKDAAVVWCHLNVEGDILAKKIRDCVQVKGSNSDEEKEEAYEAFATGAIKKLVIKPKIGAWGLNWQHCAHVVSFASHCYDEITEILTKRGWLRFADVSLRDEVATVNPESLAFEWQHPVDVVWSLYEGPMIHFGNAKHARGFDLLVTPNHRMFVRRCSIRHPSSDAAFCIKTAAHLHGTYKRQEYRMLSVPRAYSGSDLENVDIPSYARKACRVRGAFNRAGNLRGMRPTDKASGRLIRIQSLPIDTFIQLAGWYLIEGNCGFRKKECDGQIRITQTTINAGHRAEIIALLKSIDGVRVYDKTKDIRICSKQLATFLVEQFGAGSHDKRIPRWVMELDRRHLSLLRDTMLKGDGCSVRRGGIKRSYRTVSKRLADDFVELCLKTGIRGSIKFRPNNSRDRYSSDGIWEVNIARRNLEPSIHIAPEIVAYNGMIGCVTVPNGTVIVRRNGIPIVSGNSWEQFYQGIRRCWRFGQDRRVVVDVIATEGERHVLDNMKRKQEGAIKMFTELVAHMNSATRVERGTYNQEVGVPRWL